MDPIKISPELLAKAGASAMTLAPGDVIFKQGEVPDKMYGNRVLPWHRKVREPTTASHLSPRLLKSFRITTLRIVTT